jgi:hypothetical protein
MTSEIPIMSTEDTLLAFSEWLDSEGLIKSDVHEGLSHEDLAQNFIDHWESDQRGAMLAGRNPCDNYTAPHTCLSVGCTTPCDQCRSGVKASEGA